MARKRRNFSAQEKVWIPRRHPVEKVPVSDLCDEQSLHPTLFYKRQKEFFEHGAAAFERNNGKIEPRYGTLKRECIRPGTPLSLEDAKRLVARFVEHYNTVRLHSAIGYVTPKDKLEGRAHEILQARDQKLEAAREARKLRRKKPI